MREGSIRVRVRIDVNWGRVKTIVLVSEQGSVLKEGG